MFQLVQDLAADHRQRPLLVGVAGRTSHAQLVPDVSSLVVAADCRRVRAGRKVGSEAAPPGQLLPLQARGLLRASVHPEVHLQPQVRDFALLIANSRSQLPIGTKLPKGEVDDGW